MSNDKINLWNFDKSKKLCKDCNEFINISNFYKLVGNIYSSQCKKHYNHRRKINMRKNRESKIKVLRGFYGLNVNIQKEISDDYNINKLSFLKISKKYDINYQNLLNWQDKIKIKPIN